MERFSKFFSSVADAWTGFWFAEMSAYPMALFRLLFGCFLLVYFLGGLNYISLFYSNVGVYSPLFISDIAPSPPVAMALYFITVALIVALMIGYRVRVVAPLVMVFYLYHFFLNIGMRACSYDRLILMALIFLCIAPSDQVLSVTSRNRQTDADPTVSGWPAKLLALHLCLFYLSTGLYKFLSPDWHGGEIIKGVMTSLHSSDLGFAMVGLKLPLFLYQLMAASVIVFEFLCPIGFFIRDMSIKLAFFEKPIHVRGVQYYFFLAGMCFHAGIWIFMLIPQFFICPVFYALFMPAADIKRVARWVGERYDAWATWAKTPLEAVPE
jgi:hypothetical protein